MDPRRSFWIAILAYGTLSAAAFLPPATPVSAVGGVAGLLVAASGGYASLRPERVGGPDEWNLPVLAAIGGAALYAGVTVLGAV
jgi:hypothetical protein